MKLNNKGWGFTTFIFYLSIFAVFIIIVTMLAIKNANIINPTSQKGENHDTVSNEEQATSKTNYNQIEEELKSAAYQYQQEYLPNMANEEVKYVTASKLEELKFLDNLTDGNVLCTGYAKITYNNGKNDVMAFINCGDYITEGYNEELDQ